MYCTSVQSKPQLLCPSRTTEEGEKGLTQAPFDPKFKFSRRLSRAFHLERVHPCYKMNEQQLSPWELTYATTTAGGRSGMLDAGGGETSYPRPEISRPTG